MRFVWQRASCSDSVAGRLPLGSHQYPLRMNVPQRWRALAGSYSVTRVVVRGCADRAAFPSALFLRVAKDDVRAVEALTRLVRYRLRGDPTA